MSELGVITVEKRSTVSSKNNKQLRRDGYVPASISCRGKESVSVLVKADELRRSLSTYGRNALFKLAMDGDSSVTGMVKDIQYSTINREMLNVDLQQVSLNEEIRADLAVRLKGLDVLEFKKLMVLPQMDFIRVKGLPQDIPDDIVIDVSNVKGVENINIKDVEFPKGIVPEIDPEQCILSIVEVRRGSSAKGEPSEEEIEA